MSVNWQRLVSLSFNQTGGFVSVNWQRLVSLSFNWAKRDLILLPKVLFCPDLLPGLQMVLADQGSLSGTAFLLMEVGSGVFSLQFLD